MNESKENITMPELSLSRVFRTVFFLIGCAMTVLFLSEIVSGYGWNLGTLSGFALSLLLMGYTHFYDRVNAAIIEHRKRSRVAKIAQNCAVFFAVLIVTYVITASIMMIAFAHRKAPESDRPPVVVVLGCLVVNDHPSSLLSERIKTAYEYLSANPDSPCIVSGGMGNNEQISEAQCMYQELVRMGISPERIYIEDRSTTTRENLAFSKEIMERENLGDTIVLVTNSWHEFRACMIASDIDLPCGTEGAATPPWRLPSNYLRELFGIAYQFVF